MAPEMVFPIQVSKPAAAEQGEEPYPLTVLALELFYRLSEQEGLTHRRWQVGSYGRLRWPEIEPSRHRGPVCSLPWGTLVDTPYLGIPARHSAAMPVNGNEIHLRSFKIFAPIILLQALWAK